MPGSSGIRVATRSTLSATSASLSAVGAALHVTVVPTSSRTNVRACSIR